VRTKETSWPIPNRTIASLKRVAQGILLEYGEGTSLASGPGSRRSMKIGRKDGDSYCLLRTCLHRYVLVCKLFRNN